MATPTACTAEALESRARCLSNLSRKEKQAIKINTLRYAVLAMGGEDYTSIDDLMAAIACFKCYPESTLDGFDVIIARNEYIKNGGVPADWPTYNEEADANGQAVKCLMCLSDQELRVAETVLRCALSQS